MKRLILWIAAIGAGIFVLVLFRHSSDGISPEIRPMAQGGAKPKNVTPTAAGPTAIGQLNGAMPALAPRGRISESSESSAGILADVQKRQIGQLVRSGSGKVELVLNGKKLFEGRHFGYRSQSRDGIIALSAATGEYPSYGQSESSDMKDGKWLASPGQIWLLQEGRDAKLISPPLRDSWNPVISEDGTHVAYTGREIDGNGFPGSPALYVIDLTTGKTEVIPGPEKKSDPLVLAIEWTRGSKLKYLTDYGETGGHAQVMYFAVQ